MAPHLTTGRPAPLGATPDRDGVNFAVFSQHAERIEVCLFDDEGERETDRIALPERTGDVFHGHVAELRAGARYGLRAHGPYEPNAGHRFNANKLLLDPHARAIDRAFVLAPAMFGYRLGDPAADLSFDDGDSASVMPKAVVLDPLGLDTAHRPHTPWAKTVIYEMHVKGFSARLDAVPAAIRGTFAALADPSALAHLSDLRVSAVEFLPPAAWLDERHLPPLGLRNYWGYNTAAFAAPDPKLAPGGWAEVRAAVDALHAAGIEAVVDIVLNHSCESDELGPTVSLRGLDNASYYRLVPGDARHYINDMACGNCLALDRAPVVELAMAAMRTWAIAGGVDGFRFDLAPALGRRPDGFDPQAPLMEAIRLDPLLGQLKLIAEAWDMGPGGYQVGGFPPFWGDWNDRFRDDVRRFWRGDGWMLGPLATRLAGSADVFGRKLGPSRGVNFVVAHDGFALADLVAFEGKHNDANGENNRDGTDQNLSWNNGAEGVTDDPAILARRRQDQRNLLATLLLARGTPMVLMGSELGHSQQGNNNAYAQDSAISWLDWSKADAPMAAFVSDLIAVRLAHPALHEDRFLDGAALGSTGLHDVTWCNADGSALTPDQWNDQGARPLMAVFCASDQSERDFDRVAVVIHRGDHAVDLMLPSPRAGHRWRTRIDTARHPEGRDDAPAAQVLPRSVVVVAEVAF